MQLTSFDSGRCGLDLAVQSSKSHHRPFTFNQFWYQPQLFGFKRVDEPDTPNIDLDCALAEAVTATLGSCKAHAFYIIQARRDHVLADVTEKLARNPRTVHYPLFAKFADEAGVDTGGVRHELLTMVCEQALGEKYVNTNESNNVLISEQCPEQIAFTAGWVMAKLLIDGSAAPVPVSRLLIALAIGGEISLEDIAEWDQTFARALKDCETNAEVREAVGQLGVSFSKITLGNSTLFTVNCKRAVEQRYFKRREALTALRNGFCSCFVPSVINLLSSQKAFNVLEYNAVIDVDDWQSNTELVGFPDADLPDKFFELLKSDQTLAHSVLRFASGVVCPPRGGFANMKFHLQCSSSEQLPSAQTCTKTLRIPYKSNIAELERVLRLALTCQDIDVV